MALALLGAPTLGCSTDDSAGTADSVVKPPPTPPTTTALVADNRIFVLPESDDLTLLDSQAASSQDPNDGPIFATFSLAGSPDDDADGKRVSFGIADVTGISTDENTSTGAEIAVADRSFFWIREAENQRTYVGPTGQGATIVMSTLNVDEPTAMLLLTAAETSSYGVVSFDGQVVPGGWVDTGTSTTLLQFVAGATGSWSPIDGARDLYGDPANAAETSWDDIKIGFGVTLSTWPVSGTDPGSEARYNLDGEVEIEVQRADGSITSGFASAADSEFTEFVVWQDGRTWLALSRPVDADGDALEDLAAVRGATTNEVERLMSRREG